MGPRFRWVVFPLLFVTAACSESPADAVDRGEAPELGWLEANASPFATDAPGGSRADLEFLKDLVGDARVVSLGEATHGSREFFRMKHRVLEFLVHEMGFTTFAIEATWAESNHVNDYVQAGVGDPAELLANLHFWTWNTQEVLDLILWMREHNQGTPGGPGIGFFGFDMQFSRQAMDDVWDFVVAAGLGGTAVVGPGYNCWRIWERARTYSGAPAQTREECREGARAVHAYLIERRAEYEGATSHGAFANALRAARVVVQHEHYASLTSALERTAVRDTYMAENAAWILEQAGPEARIVLWAHNAHVRDHSIWMGRHLRDRFGSGMVVIGFSFHRGGLNAIPMFGGEFAGPATALEAPPAKEASYEHQFHRLGHPRFAVDLRPLREEPPPEAAWLLGPRPFRMVGAVYDPVDGDRFFSPASLPFEYDVMIHFEETTPTVLLPFPE